jgi:FKBP-type peptidyl-prolyl cis-trans isomerase
MKTKKNRLKNTASNLNMNSKKVFLIGFLLFFYACDNSLEEDKKYSEISSIESYIKGKNWTYEVNGDVYHVIKDKYYGYQLNYGDTILFWYKGYTIKSPILVFDTNIKDEALAAKLDTSVRILEPFRAIIGKTSLLKGLEKGLLLCRENESTTILFPSNLGYKDNTMGPVEPWSSLAFDVEIIYHNGPGKVNEQNIIKDLNLDGYTQHSSGLYYKIITNTGLTSPTEKDTIYGQYEVKTMSGITIESNKANADEPIALSSLDLEALKIGFTLTTTGGSLEIIAPSPLAYGKDGNDIVDPYTPVEVIVKLDSIKNN